MTDNHNHKLSDDELEAFLDGRHAVSQAHAELDKVSPPRELDARILARARAAVGKSGARESVFKEPIFSRPYATAATVFLCLGITFLFLNDPSVPVPADFPAQNPEAIQRAVQVTLEQEPEQEQAQAPTRAPLAPAREADAVTVSPDTPEEEVVRQSVTAGERVAEDVAESTENAGNSTGAAAPGRTESPDNLLNLVEVRRLGAGNEQQARSLASTAVIANSLFTYRSDREDWLQEIARLRAEGATDSASEEETLFLERYPGTDIEAALEALEAP